MERDYTLADIFEFAHRLMKVLGRDEYLKLQADTLLHDEMIDKLEGSHPIYELQEHYSSAGDRIEEWVEFCEAEIRLLEELDTEPDLLDQCREMAAAVKKVKDSL